MKTALIAGSTGLVGMQCLQLLLNSPRYGLVKALSRTPLPQQHPKLQNLVVDFARLKEYTPQLAADDIFCALGTTMRRAGSKEDFRRVDYDYTLQLAKLTLAQGARQLLLVSALGANPNSLIFYSHVKGELEDELAKLSFLSVSIARPSFLTGPRQEFRMGEKVGLGLARGLSFAMRGRLQKYRPIAAKTVAQALLLLAEQEAPGVRVLESDALAALARSVATAV